MSTLGYYLFRQMRPKVNTYPTASQATGVARTLSKSARSTVVVYKTADNRFVTAALRDAVNGLVVGIYQNGYVLPGSQPPVQRAC